MPWRTLGLVGPGPKAQKHSQNSETCCTYGWGLHYLKKKKKKIIPWANLDCFQIMEMFRHLP